MSSEPTLREITLDLRRRIKKTEKALSNYINDINAQADENLRKRAFVSGFEAEIESDLSAYKTESSATQQSFILEVDKRLEDQSQHRATRLHHKIEISKLLPLWILTLDKAWESCAAIGHNDKLYWRSAAAKLLKQASEESKLDEFSYESRLRIDKLILNINTKKSQQVMDLLRSIKEGYVSSREDHGSELGGHSVHFRGADALVDRVVVPHPRNQWSQKLDGNSIILQQSRSVISMDIHGDEGGVPGVGGFTQSHLTAPTGTDGEPSWIMDSYMESPKHESMQMSYADKTNSKITRRSSSTGDIYKGKKSKAFMEKRQPVRTIHSSMTNVVEIGITLRYLASRGDIDSAWQQFLLYLEKQNKFYHFDVQARTLGPHLRDRDSVYGGESATLTKESKFGDYSTVVEHQGSAVNSTGATIGNKPSAAEREQVSNSKSADNPHDNDSTRELFLMLMKAFKNSKELNFNMAWLIIKTMILYGLEPDIRIMNIMMRSCERRSMWRRVLSIMREMLNPSSAANSPCGGMLPRIEPNAHTFDILIACCRHAIDEPGDIFKTLRADDLPVELCYKAAVCNAGNRVSGQAARDQARQAKEESDRHKRFLSRWRKKRNASSGKNNNASASSGNKMKILTSLSDSSDESVTGRASPVRFPPIGPENSYDSSFIKSPTGGNATMENSYNDAFSSFYEGDLEADGISKGSSRRDHVTIGSKATETSDDENSYGEDSNGPRSPERLAALQSTLGDSPVKGNSIHTGLYNSGFTHINKAKVSDNPFASNVSNDYGGAGGGERSSEWNLLSSRMAEGLPGVSPARHRTGPSALSFENHLAKVVKGQSSTRFSKGVGGIAAAQSVSKILRSGMNRAISPMAAKSYFSANSEEEVGSLGERSSGRSMEQDEVSHFSQNSNTARLSALTSSSLFSNPSYLGRSMLNLTTLK